MSNEQAKKVMTRSALGIYGVFYHPEVYPGPADSRAKWAAEGLKLPEGVEGVREELLAFGGIVPGEWERELREENEKWGGRDVGPEEGQVPPRDAFIWPDREGERDGSVEWMRATRGMEDARREARRARKKLEREVENGREDWESFWWWVFRQMFDEWKERPGYIPALDALTIHKSFKWDEFDISFEHKVLVGRRNLPEPKITYAFPIVQTLFPKETKGFARDELSQALTPQVLKKLVQQGISCAPTTAIEEGTNLRSRVPLMGPAKPCFPWAIVEMNRDGPTPSRSEEICYCQAANTAAIALQLQTKLFDSLGKDAIFQRPPVIAFTCVGPIVKVWLAYESNPSLSLTPRQQRMVCIWSTSAQLTWGIASLHAIIMNMKTWASRILKPRIQTCVLQASRKTGPIPPKMTPIPKPTSSIFSYLPTTSSTSSPSLFPQSSSTSLSDHKIASTKKIKKENQSGTLKKTPQDSVPDDFHRSSDDPQVDTSGKTKSPSDHKILPLRSQSSQSNGSTKSPFSSSKVVPASVSKSPPTNPAASPQPSSGPKISAPRFSSSEFTFNSSPVISMFDKGVDSSKIPPNKVPTPSSSSSSRGSSMQPDKPATSPNPTLLASSTPTQGPPVPKSADEVIPSNQTPEEDRLRARIAALESLKHIKVTDPGDQTGQSEIYDMIQADVEKVVDDLKLNLQKDLARIYERHYRAALGEARESGEMDGTKDDEDQTGMSDQATAQSTAQAEDVSGKYANRHGGSKDEEKATENSDGAKAMKSDEQKPMDSTQKEPKADHPKDEDSESEDSKSDSTEAFEKDHNSSGHAKRPEEAREAEES